MNGLLDFLQGASNAAASNVTAPVDLINWLLQKAGLPVSQAPVGGSAWAEQKGLTKKPQNALLGMGGETAGLLSPVVAAAKAPQIAKGLLQMGENAAAPRTLNPQTGAIVWHGSPHKFDRFDSSKIGTGEGAQAYGHGLYLAEAPDVADGYRKTLSGGKAVLPRALSAAEQDLLDRAVYYGNQVGGDVTTGLQYLERNSTPDRVEKIRALMGKVQKDGGSLYKVDLPDPVIARMLDWDKPLSQQAPVVQRALAKFPAQMKGQDAYSAMSYGVEPAGFDDAGRALFDGMAALRGRNPANAVQALRQQGIPGIRYLDGGSRGAGAGTSNFVVFPGEENVLRILERNGHGLLAP